MKLKDIRAVLFDLDGTLLDSTELILQAYEHTITTNGLPHKTRKEIIVTFGKPLEECYSILFPNENIKQLMETHIVFQTNNLEIIKPFENVKKTLASLKHKGLKIAAVTTRSKRTTVKSLEINDLDKFFDIIISREDVVNPKPHSEPLLKALAYLKFHPSQAIMVGDTVIDVQAGKNAGTKTIAVSYGMHSDSIRRAKPDFIIDTISQLQAILF